MGRMNERACVRAYRIDCLSWFGLLYELRGIWLAGEVGSFERGCFDDWPWNLSDIHVEGAMELLPTYIIHTYW